MNHVSHVSTEPVRASEGGFLALMRHRNYALLWFGQLISQTGDRFHWVAISLWVYAQTGSALSVSYAIMALMVGPALVGVFAGALVDRLDRRKILIYADLSRAILVFLIPDLMKLGMIWVYLDLFLVSVASAFFRPAMFAAIPQSVPKERLLNANAFFASMDTSTEIFGPALAGLVVAAAGYAAAIYIDAFSYMASALFVSALHLPDASPPRTRGSLGVVSAIREGLRYIRADRIQVALIAFLLTGYWVAGLNSLQIPLAIGVIGLSAQQFGWFQGVGGIGLVVASVLLGWRGAFLPKGQAIVLAYLLWALAAGFMGLSANFGMLMVAGFWIGFANMLVFVNAGTVMMEHTPPDKIGRVITTRQVVVAFVRAAALILFGWLADTAGARLAVLAMALVSFGGTLVAATLFPMLWHYQARLKQADPETKDAQLPIRLPSPSGLVKYLDTHTTPEFAVVGQRWLNGASLLIVTAGWLLFLIISPFQAVGVAAVVVGTIISASLVRFLTAWLRLRAEGSEALRNAN